MRFWPPSDLSLRIKIPLRAALLVLITASVITFALLAREYAQMRTDVVAGAARWSSVLGKTLVGPLRNDDVWRIYEVMRAATSGEEGHDLATTISLIDTGRRIFASTSPQTYPVLAPLHELGGVFREIDARLVSEAQAAVKTLEAEQRFFLLSPIEEDGVLLGHLLLEYSTSLFSARFVDLWWRATVVTLLVLLLILPVSIYWGRRLADPLVALADCMGKIGHSLPSTEDCQLIQSRDELGQVSNALRRLLVELKEKQSLEEQIIFTERLTAVGRLAGGIAHEINNPLGGMLNAINTYQRHGAADPELTARTISLLDRGLKQIKSTISALLVEAKAPSHPFGTADIDDVRVLIQSDVEKKSAALSWQSDVTAELPLPATLVRQVLINLLLNALHAVDPGGKVSCRLLVTDDDLQILVENDGAHISAERMPFLFEPFFSKSNGGHGLGLWITYQIVHQLGGDMSVRSEPGWTAFAIRLPLHAEIGGTRLQEPTS